MNEPNDDELEHELRRLAAEAEPVPAELLQAAVAAFGWRDIDAEIVEQRVVDQFGDFGVDVAP